MEGKNETLFSCITILLIILSIAVVSASASDFSKDVIDLGDGFYMTEIKVQQSYFRASDIIAGKTTGNVYHGSTFVGTATLHGTFDISGATAKATDSAISGTGYNGGRYISGTSYCSGNKVYGNATFTFNGIQKTLSLSISCSPDGTIS